MWHQEAFYYDSHLVGRGYIAILCQHIKSKSKCVVINVYAACNLIDKVVIWENLRNAKDAHPNLAWCFCGDFNAVRHENERKGTSTRVTQKKEINGFNNFIERNFMVELPIVGKNTFGTRKMVKLRADWIECL